MQKFGLIVAGVLGVVVLIALLTLFSAFTVSTLWGWFIVPLGVKGLGLAHAYGVSLMASVLMSTRGVNNGGKTKEIAATGIMLNIIALLFGYIAVSFM